jgi:ribonucleoside-triphosphate reductase
MSTAAIDPTGVDSNGPPSSELPTLYQQYIHMGHYSRWRDDLRRRETWSETIGRASEFFVWLAANAPTSYEMSPIEVSFIEQSMLDLQAMCSARLLMTAGEAAKRDAAAIYNCTYVAVNDPRAFDEAMYLLMCGTGVGFSVERQEVKKLPEVPDRLYKSESMIVVDDNRRSWAASYRQLLAMLWAGHIPKWDVSRLRPAGSRLKTFGGRASGPAPLVDLFRFTVDTFKEATGRRLRSIECHSLMCKIGDIVVSGGVRRSALISLSNPSDERMRDAKSGDWRDDASRKHFQLANNSAVWTEKPEIGRFMREWIALYESKSGERGIVNREALLRDAERIGRATTYEDGTEIPFGVNPCGEISLRPAQMCNLTNIVVRATDTLDDLRRKATAATIMGTLQSTCTHFDYLRPIWRKNCEEERLLGVGLGGELDHPVFAERGELADEWKREIKLRCREVNADWADRLGIPRSASITCQKPDGNTSQLFDAASGGHARYARFYVRRVRCHELDPIADVIKASGVPWEKDVYKDENVVFAWPIKAPDGAVVKDDMTAIDQLERWLHTKTHYTEHNPSCTIEIGEHEWLGVGAWVYDHFDEVAGLSFLPSQGNHGYTQLPYEEVDADEYERLVASMPLSIDWNLLAQIEHEDNTKGSRELACSANNCETP